MNNMNFSQIPYQAQLIDDLLQQLNSTTFLNKGAKSETVDVSNLPGQNLSSVIPFLYHDNGIVYKINQDEINLIRKLQIEKLAKQLEFQTNSSILNIIPEDNRIVFANSLMNLNAVQVHNDIKKWISSELHDQFIIQFRYIRYFYFQDLAAPMNAQQLKMFKFSEQVKYRNQAVVLVGILEQCIDQPFLYLPIFIKVIKDLEQFYVVLPDSDMKLLGRSLQELIESIKLIAYKRLTGDSSYEANQVFFRLLNRDVFQQCILLKFVEYLFGVQDKKDFYGEQNMDIFDRYEKVKIYLDKSKIEDDHDNLDNLNVFILYEIENGLNNCHLIYSNPFLKLSGINSDEILPIICGRCQSAELKSSLFMTERRDPTQQQLIRLCKSCLSQ